jgi:hypothetical protein
MRHPSPPCLCFQLKEMRPIDNVYKEVAESLGISCSEIKKAYKLYWEFFKKVTEEMTIKQDGYTKEEFEEMRTSFNVKYIGKFGCTYKRYVGKKIIEEKKKRYVENKRMQAALESCNSNGK